jgi:hypothetical protein
MRKPFVVLAAVLCWATGAAAQDQARCQAGETIRKCWDRVSGARGADIAAEAAAAAPAAAAETREELEGKTTGINLLQTGTASSIEDFLPLLRGALTTATDGDGQALALDLNIPKEIFELGGKFGIRTLLHEPALYGPLVDSLGQAGSAAATRLRESLGSFDDVSIIGAWNLESRAWGRNFDAYRSEVAAVFTELANEAPDSDDALVAFARVLEDAAKQLDPARAGQAPCSAADVETWTFDCFTPAGAVLVEQALIAAATAQRLDDERLTTVLERSGFNLLAELINNQPQFNVSMEYRPRRDIAGPTELTGKLRLEFGGENMNDLRRFCGARQSALNAECLRGYTAQQGVRERLRRGARSWFSADFSQREGFNLDLPDDGVMISLPRDRKLALSGGLGSYVGVDEEGTETGRWDLKAEYDFHDGDSERQDRLLAGLTYTHRLSASSSVVVGLSWANKAEFLDQDVRRFGAHVGFSYKLVNGNDN